MSIDPDRLEAAIDATREHLLSLRAGGSWWEGRLSSSAVSTATAAMALRMAGRDEDRELVEAAVRWLQRTQNADGGWGDTPDSPSNIAATLLSICALTVADAEGQALAQAREHVADVAGERPEEIVGAVTRRYGEDRTFAAPVLAACALAGLVPWSQVPSLPVELAALPRSWHRLLRLQVVSYALPALIAVGAVIHRHSPPLNPLTRLMRSLTLGRALGRLPELQPEHGGFLEAAPLTGFVAMSLIPVLGAEDGVVQRSLQFLRDTAREDGSWPIDTNLSVWVTTNALQALRHSGGIPPGLAGSARRWLLEQQHSEVHPFTGAAPGGWAWTHLSGGVPDADDTAGAVLLMAAMGEQQAAMAGGFWLVGLHNLDGGWPTFCQGWGRLPFDQSSPDITGHALRAHNALLGMVNSGEESRLAGLIGANLRRVGRQGFRYLEATQREDGSWVPLWFGNQEAPGQRNPVFGTARVLAAWGDCGRADDDAARRGVQYLLRAQNEDGGWGGAAGVRSSMEETAVAVSALTRFTATRDVQPALETGVTYLLRRVKDGSWTEPTPIGLYFAALWYAEDLYPVAWTVEALGRAREAFSARMRPPGTEPSSALRCQ
ncbi:MAG: prenyltransferase/squalene oxidase repeat-containing protein [Armatimonadota bacterium]|nr:prenyltransferase/squalene oxidase repeat-containing protein [Armatimonadota bacterium]